MWIKTPKCDLVDLDSVAFISKDDDYQTAIFYIWGNFKSDGSGFIIMSHPDEKSRDEYFERLIGLLVKGN